jgi:hypothetical protein
VKKNKEERGTCYEIKWKPPVHDVLKINIAGSMDPANASGGWGLVFRDELGIVAGLGASHMEHLQDVLHSEAEAYLQSLFQAQIWCISRVHVELTHNFWCNRSREASNGAIFTDIKFQISLNFSVFSIL